MFILESNWWEPFLTEEPAPHQVWSIYAPEGMSVSNLEMLIVRIVVSKRFGHVLAGAVAGLEHPKLLELEPERKGKKGFDYVLLSRISFLQSVKGAAALYLHPTLPEKAKKAARRMGEDCEDGDVVIQGPIQDKLAEFLNAVENGILSGLSKPL